MAAVVVIEGREFAVGDAVLVDDPSCASECQQVAGTIGQIADESARPYRIGVRFGRRRSSLRWYEASEVHTMRENFA